MKRTLALACLLLFGIQTANAVEKSEAAKQLQFGVKMALKGSWHEAAFRFEKSVELDPSNPAAFNNLAVARESLGEFEKARVGYEKALALDPGNKRISENHTRFVNFYKTFQRGDGAK